MFVLEIGNDEHERAGRFPAIKYKNVSAGMGRVPPAVDIQDAIAHNYCGETGAVVIPSSYEEAKWLNVRLSR